MFLHNDRAEESVGFEAAVYRFDIAAAWVAWVLGDVVHGDGGVSRVRNRGNAHDATAIRSSASCANRAPVEVRSGYFCRKPGTNFKNRANCSCDSNTMW